MVTRCGLGDSVYIVSSGVTIGSDGSNSGSSRAAQSAARNPIRRRVVFAQRNLSGGGFIFGLREN